MEVTIPHTNRAQFRFYTLMRSCITGIASLALTFTGIYHGRAESAECPPGGCPSLERVTITGTRFYEQDISESTSWTWMLFDFNYPIDLPDSYDLTLAKLENSFDVRCLDPGSSGDLNNVKSSNSPDERRRAAQLAYDRLAQRVQEGLFSSVWRNLFGNLRTITVTFADGGTEMYDVRGLVGSITLNRRDGSLVEGSGQVEPVESSKCSTQA